MSHRLAQPKHYSLVLEETDEGWYPGRCACGWDGGMFPTAEDACDALMDHAYAAGVNATSQEPPE